MKLGKALVYSWGVFAATVIPVWIVVPGVPLWHAFVFLGLLALTLGSIWYIFGRGQG